MKVSVMMIAYNHEKFIAQAIESVLVQRASFPYELVISDDCSTDGTGRLAADFAAHHPDRVRLIHRERNIGAKQNWYSTFAACTGQYIAVVEGDDFWTDDRKLQRQADAMDAHPSWAMSFHRARCVWEGDESTAQILPRMEWKPTLPLADLVHQCLIATCTSMFRRGVVTDFPPCLMKVYGGDYATFLLHALHGEVGFLDETMAYYRQHRGGMWTGLTTDEQHARLYQDWKVLRPLVNKFSGNYRIMADHDNRMARVMMAKGQTSLARRYAWHGALGMPLSRYNWRVLLWTLLGRRWGKWLRPE